MVLLLIFVGILLIGLSGLEKIILYSSLSDRAREFDVFVSLVPSDIWSITNVTFIGGIILTSVGIIWFVAKLVIDNRSRNT